MTLDEARDHVGHGVVYRAGTDLAEDGVITGVGALVFVRYAGDQHAKATYPGDLVLLDGGGTGPRGPSFSNGPGVSRLLRDLPHTVRHWDFTEGRPYE